MKTNVPYILFFTFLGFIWCQCDDGYTEYENECYYNEDLNVLQEFINNSQDGDNPPPFNMLPIDLGVQVWENGPAFLSSEAPFEKCIGNSVHEGVELLAQRPWEGQGVLPAERSYETALFMLVNKSNVNGGYRGTPKNSDLTCKHNGRSTGS